MPERRAWSIVIGEKGFDAFVDALLDSDEYMASFGYDRVPEQRSRKLPGQSTGEMPIYQRFPRYASDHRDMLWEQKLLKKDELNQLPTWMQKPPAWAKKFWLGLALVGSVEILRILVIVAGSMLSTR